MNITHCADLIEKLKVLPHFNSISAKDIFKEISFATPLMWSHTEYAMALMMKARSDLL